MFSPSARSAWMPFQIIARLTPNKRARSSPERGSDAMARSKANWFTDTPEDTKLRRQRVSLSPFIHHQKVLRHAMIEPDRQLDPRVITLWRLSRAMRLAFFGVPFAAMVGLGIGQLLGPTVGAIAGAVLLSINFMVAMTWPALQYRYFRYAVREHDLLVQAGVLFRRWSAVPHSRIQHVDTRQGPLERTLGLARLQIFTAAGVSADGSIPGLAEEEAERLRDELSQRGGVDDGV